MAGRGLFFEVFMLTRADLSTAWIDNAWALADTLGPRARSGGYALGGRRCRGLLIDLLGGADEAEVDAAYELLELSAQ